MPINLSSGSFKYINENRGSLPSRFIFRLFVKSIVNKTPKPDINLKEYPKSVKFTICANCKMMDKSIAHDFLKANPSPQAIENRKNETERMRIKETINDNGQTIEINQIVIPKPMHPPII